MPRGSPDGPHPFDVYVGARIKMRRDVLGLNQSDLARFLNLTFQQVQKYEKGANRVSASKLLAISQALDVPFGWWAEGFDPKIAVPADPPPQTEREFRVLRYLRKATPVEIDAVVALLRRLTLDRGPKEA